MFTATMLLLMSYSIINEKMEHEASFLTYSMYGIISGILLYSLFWLGHFFIDVLDLPFQKEVTKLYKLYSPAEIWQYLVFRL